MSDLTRYDELQATVKAAYTYHVETYSMMHPPPEKRAAEISRLDLIVAFSLVVLVLASVIVSGSRTIAEFGAFIGGNIGIVVGVSAFVMLEIALVIYAFFDTKKSGAHSDRYVVRMTRLGIGIAFVVSVFANIHAISKAQGNYVSPIIDGLILLLVAISAPTLALISGHILGSEVVSILNRKAEVDSEYLSSKREWDAALNRSWDSQKAKLGVRIEVMSEPPVSLSDGQDRQGQTRTDKQDMVMNYLTQFPEDAALPSRVLAEKVSEYTNTTIGHDATNRARNAWRNGQ